MSSQQLFSVPRRQQGFLLVAAIVLIVGVALLGMSLTFVMTGNIGAGVSHHGAAQALFLAESGLERGAFAITTPNLGARQACAAVNVANAALGNGAYTVTGAAPVYPATPTTVNMGVGGLSAAATTVTVASTAGYAARGRIMIDRELIDYARITATTFEVAARGAGGTTAVAHATGTRIGQDQCDLTATGGVPNVAGAQGRRQLRHGVQLQEGWAAGQATATSFTTQNLNAVFCFPGGTECWAVGNAGAIGRWSGASWTDFTFAGVGALRAVTCALVNDCWIVGDNSGGEVILRWDGANWTRLVPAAGLPDINLRSVYCTATNNCWAVGAAWNPPGGGTPNQGAILFWNGATWTARQDLAATAAPNTQLNSVHCVDANNCWIVGNSSGGQQTMLRWTGGPNWTRIGSTGPNSNLLGVACAVLNDCHAVGPVSGGNEVTMRWTTGPNWTRVGPDAAIANVNFNSVICVATNDCWAVGNASGGNYRIIHWTGGANWSDSSLAAAGTQNLNGVSCLNASDCWAVANGGQLLRWNGTSWSLFGAGTTVLRWNTTAWANVTGTAVVPAGIAQLNAVSLLSYADGWAVGNTSGGEVMLRWTGGPNWARVGPIGAIPDTNLNNIYCVASNDCWIVGNNSGGETILRWTGGPNWARLGPIGAIPNTNLNSVHCVATNDCWIVGNNSGGETILRWTGGPNWTRLAPAAGLPDINLRSVYCTATNNCWAVGAAWNPPGGGTPNQGAILFWNGATWTARQDLAATAAPNTQLNSVHCVDANNCWIVGNQSGGEVILRWTGGPNWTRVGPSAALPNVNLQVIACVHASDCWAVGDTGARFHWDGTSWSSVTIPAVTANLYGLGLIGARTRPQAGWQEIYP